MTKNKTTTTTAVAVIDEGRLAALRQKDNSAERSSGNWPTALTVNRSPLTKDDKPLPMGKFTVKLGEELVFLDSADVIIITKGTQFRRWKDGKVYIGSTMIEKPGKAEYKDTQGTIKLGKFVGEADTLTEEQKKVNKEIKFYFMLLGLVDVSKAVKADGTRVHEGTQAVWHPIKLEFSGKNAVLKQDELRKIKGKNEANFDFVTRLTKPHRAGEAAGVPFYEYNFERGDNTVFTEEILASIEGAQELIDSENMRIYKLHLAANASETSEEDDTVDYASLDLNDE